MTCEEHNMLAATENYSVPLFTVLECIEKPIVITFPQPLVRAA